MARREEKRGGSPAPPEASEEHPPCEWEPEITLADLLAPLSLEEFERCACACAQYCCQPSQPLACVASLELRPSRGQGLLG